MMAMERSQYLVQALQALSAPPPATPAMRAFSIPEQAPGVPRKSIGQNLQQAGQNIMGVPGRIAAIPGNVAHNLSGLLGLGQAAAKAPPMPGAPQFMGAPQKVQGGPRSSFFGGPR